MEFVRCAIDNNVYDVREGEDKEVINALKGEESKEDSLLREFFIALAVCHTVIIEPSSGDYQVFSFVPPYPFT